MVNEHILFTEEKFSIYLAGDLVPKENNPQAQKVIEQHFHKEYELLYCQSDSIDFIIENVTYKLLPGDIMFVNSNVPHKTVSYKDTAYLLVQFKSPFEVDGNLKYLSRFGGMTDNMFCIFKGGMPQTEEIKNCIVKMIDENQKRRPAFEYYLSANMHMIVAVLCRSKVITDNIVFENAEKLMPVIEFVNKNYDRQVSVAEAADIMKIDKAYFCRLFKKICNCTFTEYVNFVRICKSERILKSGGSVSEAAYSTGFASQSYYNKIFKKYKLCSPTEYKSICRFRQSNV